MSSAWPCCGQARGRATPDPMAEDQCQTARSPSAAFWPRRPSCPVEGEAALLEKLLPPAPCVVQGLESAGNDPCPAGVGGIGEEVLSCLAAAGATHQVITSPGTTQRRWRSVAPADFLPESEWDSIKQDEEPTNTTEWCRRSGTAPEPSKPSWHSCRGAGAAHRLQPKLRERIRSHWGRRVTPLSKSPTHA